MLNKVILALINSQTYAPKAMESDALEKAASYKGWIYPFRYLLALRYLKIKQGLLKAYRDNKIFPVSEDEFKDALIKALSKRPAWFKRLPLPALLFKSSLLYPVLLAGLVLGALQLNEWYHNKKIGNVLANHLPYYSDLLHRKLLLKHNDRPSLAAKLEKTIEAEKKTILAELPEKDGVRALVAEQLDKLKDPDADSEAIMLGFKQVNTLFDKKGIPFYLTPKSFTLPCSSLIDAPVEEMMMLKKLEELMSKNNPQRCRTTMMTSYKVNQRDRLMYSENDKAAIELPLFQVERIDKVPAIDSALGLTFKERGIGSIILNDRIRRFAEESVLPALTFQGRNYIIPYWMQGYYEIEEAITKGYKKDLEKIYPNKAERLKVKKLVKKLIKDKTRMQNAKMQQTLETTATNTSNNIFGSGFDAISVLLGKLDKSQKSAKENKPDVSSISRSESQKLLAKLNAVLLPSIEYHEAYHQIDKKHWKKPAWIKTTFKEELSDAGLDHTLEELGAYLAQLANTRQGHNIWLSKLLIFSLNPMTKGQAEYYASGIILSTLDSLNKGLPMKPSFDMSVDKKTEIYSSLVTLDEKQIKNLAKYAYEVLFEREVPILK